MSFIITGWLAPRKSLLLVHPSGLGSRSSNNDLNISFRPIPPDYAGIARAAAGGEGELWAEKASSARELERLLPLAVESVLGGRGAVLDAVLS